MPVAVSFTVETDGRLPTGQPLGDAIEEVDAETGGYPAYYMLNCAHPEHFRGALSRRAAWTTPPQLGRPCWAVSSSSSSRPAIICG